MATQNGEVHDVMPAFTVEHWAAFWASPDPERAVLITDDVIGDWPGDDEPVRGAAAYRARIKQAMDEIPGLWLEVLEHATNGEFIFIRWRAHGTGVAGPLEIDGFDRFLIEDGRVKENIIRYDTKKYDHLVFGR